MKVAKACNYLLIKVAKTIDYSLIKMEQYIEVKAKNSKSKSLNQLIKSDKYEDISFGIKLCADNIGFENDIYTFPYYCTFLLKRYIKEKYM